MADTKVYNIDTVPKAYKVGGVEDSKKYILKVSIADTDSAGDIFRIAKVPSNYIPKEIKIFNTAITGATDVDLGFYLLDSFGGTVKDADVLVDGADLSAAHAVGSGLEGMSALSVSDLGKDIATLLDDSSSEYQAYDLALTLNSDPTASGTIVVVAEFVYGA